MNAEAPLNEVLGALFPWCVEWEAELRKLFAAYVEAKQKQNVLDYDDLLLYWAQMMAARSIADDLSSRFDHVMVDEYQDTNRLQASILLNFKPTGRGLTVVGDDAQSIYSFRAATVRNILDFPGHFTPKAALITLEQNYRSTQPILAAANAVIDLASERFTKNLWSDRASSDLPALVNVADDNAQAGYIVETILANREAGIAAEIAGRAVSHVEPQRVARSRADTAQHSLRQIRRPEIPRSGAHQGRAGGLALGATICATAWRDFASRSFCRALGRARRRSCSMRMAASGDPCRRPARVQAARRRPRNTGRTLSRRSARCI